MIGDVERARSANERIKANLATNRDLARERDVEMARLHILDALPQAEIARRLGVSESAVRLAVRLYGEAERQRAQKTAVNVTLPVAG
ncbi:hypothetical protein AB0395_22120 [Streptosporangium sp. NPDC051023]|uniref:hypothetical protein n=1 Tax=Streptosporangium sp. NPDC051023 TaxID=3155410 RepID=UPI00344B7459